jgi:hypothetical protein
MNKQSLCYFLTLAHLQESQCSELDPLVLSQILDSDDDDHDDGGDDDDSSGDEGQPLPRIHEEEEQVMVLPAVPVQSRPNLRAKRLTKAIPKPPIPPNNMSSSSSGVEPTTPRPAAADMLQRENPPIPPLPGPTKRSTRQPIKIPDAPQSTGRTRKVRISRRVFNGGKIYRSSTYKNKGKRYKTFRKKRNVKANAKSANKHPNKHTRRDRRGRN